ncbi:Gfo/Idh/MocA family protein [Sphingosinicella sp. BN140058]|uniref:Gfo/Idh/MocA family protein n=1 Tax=Sphingosinicella sp. BN140058 TaxID=1892855 RepID=UPI0010135A56|nr:Gfo/Idh/MocA family oxidoreductase [Sphingosinicella sp. BN140058]QAY78266.1 Gfo/Idh/MocA family oxidoreductase [Sphingosinicella sp. BN140058]
MAPIRIAIVGYGKIAQDQHVPSIAANGSFELVATVSRSSGAPEGVACFGSVEDLLASGPKVDAVAICTPPSVRYDIARTCLDAGLHSLLEKPPGVTLGECEELVRIAAAKGVSLFTTWHAQYNPAVEAAAERLAGKTIDAMRIVWREDVREWHPGQQWIWAPGGFGVFDPGINALSIASKIFPGTLILRGAELLFPANRDTPIAARLDLTSPAATGAVTAEFDWRHSGGEAWNIEVEAAGEMLLLSEGGSHLSVGGQELVAPGHGEYPGIYAHFAELVAGAKSHVDLAPLRLTADAFLLGKRIEVEAFED